MADTSAKTISDIANNPLVIFTSRAMQIVVLPLVSFLFWQIWNGQTEARLEFRLVDRRITIIETQLIDMNIRLRELREASARDGRRP